MINRQIKSDYYRTNEELKINYEDLYAIRYYEERITEWNPFNIDIYDQTTDEAGNLKPFEGTRRVDDETQRQSKPALPNAQRQLASISPSPAWQ